MKANELRISNYVNRLGIAEQIQSIADGQPGYVSLKSCGIITTNQIEPIPLTEDWLVKLGFEKRFNNDDCNLFDLIGYKEMSIDGINRGQGFFTLADFIGKHGWYLDLQTRATLKHVHQLQNLYFSLTGEELTMKENDSLPE